MTVTTATRATLDRLIDPRSVAVVGASANPSKRGYQAIRALQQAGYPYPVYPVNPRGGQILGTDVLTGIQDLPAGVDLALIALPAPAVPQALRDLATRGVAGAVVLANGFAETGNAQGMRDLRQAIDDTGIRVIGPNTSGTLNTATGANLVGVPDVPAGPISLITQSGNMLLALLADLRALGAEGLDTYVGLGNQADVRYDEILTALAGRRQTRAIAVHAEGIKDGRAFLQAAARVTRSTPTVMLRGGRSQAGQAAALSHTASVAGPDPVATACLRQAGIELVDRSDELALVADVLAHTAPMRPGTGVAILSDGGGQATLAADALSHAGVPIAALTQGTRTGLRGLLGPAAGVTNPVDVAGATDADPSLFAPAARILAGDPGVGLILLVGLYGGYHLRFDPGLEPVENDTSTALADISDETRVPLLVQSCYTIDHPASHDLLRERHIPVLASVDHAVRAVTALSHRGYRLATADQRSDLVLPGTPGHTPAGAGRAVLPEPQARTLLEHRGITTGAWSLATSADDLAAAIARIGGPCAVKVVSEQVVHKSDAGGVQLGVTPDTARQAWEQIHTRVHQHTPEARIDGLIVTPMAPAGVELLVGATIDPIFGPVVTFGTGGILVEALRDVTFRAAPFTHLEATEMIGETIAARMLGGYRALPAVDQDALADFLVRVGDAVTGIPGLAELDLNPVIAAGRTITPVDVRIITTRGTA